MCRSLSQTVFFCSLRIKLAFFLSEEFSLVIIPAFDLDTRNYHTLMLDLLKDPDFPNHNNLTCSSYNFEIASRFPCIALDNFSCAMDQ